MRRPNRTMRRFQANEGSGPSVSKQRTARERSEAAHQTPVRLGTETGLSHTDSTADRYDDGMEQPQGEAARPL
jgi:hypothetical protein